MWRENKSGVGTDRRVEGEQAWGRYMVQTGVWRENKPGVGTWYRQACGGRTSLG